MNAMYDEEPTDESGAELKHNKADGVSPGEILREGRLAHDYGVEDLCAQTKLSKKTVRALEDNDFQALSQPVFARGYYRQCAKVLDLDLDRLMAAYTAWAGEPSTPRVDHRSAGSGVIPQDVTPGGFRFRGLLILLIIAVVAIAVIVFLLPSNRMLGAASGDNDNSDQGNQTTTLSLNSSDNSNDDGSAFAGNDSADTETSHDKATPDVAGDNPGQARTGRQAGGRNVNQSLGIKPPNGSNDSDRNAAGDNDAQSTPAVPPNRLVLTFSKRSWVRVTDANGNRMASGIFESGDKKEFNGKPPYKITLGFAPGVKVAIGGQSVDVAGQTNGSSIAHLTVDAPSDNPENNG